MTKLEALRKLLEKVEAGVEYETMGHTLMCKRAFQKPVDFDGSREAYANSEAQKAILVWRNNSMDAALSLFDAVLHERVGIAMQRSARYGSKVKVIDPMTQQEWENEGWEGTPARALLIAILKALISLEEGK